MYLRRWLVNVSRFTFFRTLMARSKKNVFMRAIHSHLSLLLEHLQMAVSHSTHLCQPLDGKLFLAMEHIWKENNEFACRSGQPATKSEFRKIITRARKVRNPRMIRDLFKERGIYPTDGKHIVEELWSQLPEIPLPDLPESQTNKEPSPSQELHSSSSIEEEPPKSLAQLKRNQQKYFIPSATAKQRRDMERLFKYQQILQEQLAIDTDIIDSLCAEQTSRQRKYTKR